MLGYLSKKGWFTFIQDGDALSVLEISQKDVKLVRALGGCLYDREAFAKEALSLYADSPKKFLQFKHHRLFIREPICACQLTGWKSGE